MSELQKRALEMIRNGQAESIRCDLNPRGFAYCECAPKRCKPFDSRTLNALRRKGLIEIRESVRHADPVRYEPVSDRFPLDTGGVYYCRTLDK